MRKYRWLDPATGELLRTDDDAYRHWTTVHPNIILMRNDGTIGILRHIWLFKDNPPIPEPDANGTANEGPE